MKTLNDLFKGDYGTIHVSEKEIEQYAAENKLDVCDVWAGIESELFDYEPSEHEIYGYTVFRKIEEAA